MGTKDKLTKKYMRNPEVCKAIVEIEEKGRQNGLEQGIQQGSCGTLVSLVQDGLLDIEEAAKRAHMSLDEFKLLVDQK